MAVRSSATAEDSAEFSFAGLHDTFLDVRDMAGLERAITRCWASLWSERAVAYRRAGGMATDEAAIAVVVQQLVRSDVSFVVFTADPVSGDDGHLVISATWGLGEAIVSGLVVPDNIVIGPDGAVIDYTIGGKHLMVIPGSSPGGGVREVPVPRALREMRTMTDAQAMRVGAAARGVAGRLGFQADLEGAFAGDALYLLQARPITTLVPLPGHERPLLSISLSEPWQIAIRATQGDMSMETTTINDPASAFPEDWNAPVEGNGTHYFDAMHYPFPICPLMASTHGPAFSVGFAQARREFHVPFKRVVVLARNMYRFVWHEMEIPASADEARRGGEAAEAAVKVELGRLLERWNDRASAGAAHAPRPAAGDGRRYAPGRGGRAAYSTRSTPSTATSGSSISGSRSRC